ncbi:acyl-CoA thioester hydrolase [Peribacillus frigoritolerans]|uniref:acyl-CoA thioester hydrolase n=1 Tax=Peribacillus frigoritolerans TaxID=450367 RepID=UPI0022263BDE|nr:acyl-CoA thioester hydrolase [Peribacillus frigoritolerans]UYY98716.1 acyl-CoA thioester hydrolase [Peribacillus frigoritolerans]
MKSYFGIVNEEVELISREVLKNEVVRTEFKFGKLTVTGTSNIPTDRAIIRLADGMNAIAEKNISSKLNNEVS